jgi:hypothetical protein
MSNEQAGELSPAQRASAVRAAYQAELMTKANVVGVGIGYRRVAGQQTDMVALVVMVSQKLPDWQLAAQDVIPKEIEGVPVDVQEVGRLNAQGAF